MGQTIDVLGCTCEVLEKRALAVSVWAQYLPWINLPTCRAICQSLRSKLPSFNSPTSPAHLKVVHMTLSSSKSIIHLCSLYVVVGNFIRRQFVLVLPTFNFVRHALYNVSSWPIEKDWVWAPHANMIAHDFSWSKMPNRRLFEAENTLELPGVHERPVQEVTLFTLAGLLFGPQEGGRSTVPICLCLFCICISSHELSHHQ